MRMMRWLSGDASSIGFDINGLVDDCVGGLCGCVGSEDAGVVCYVL